MQGAAAVARMPVSTYVKWLLQGSPVDGVSRTDPLRQRLRWPLMGRLKWHQ